MAWKLVPGRYASDAPSRRGTVPPEKGKKSLANQHVLLYCLLTHVSPHVSSTDSMKQSKG